MAEAPKRISPQPGPQSQFLASSADIAIYGGGAGGGKSWALLMEPLRHVHNPSFGAVFFRRTTVQIRNEGGLWDESTKIYPLLGAQAREVTLDWKFPSGATVSMSHLEQDKTVLNWQGSQIALLIFDELTHFSEGQFFYMLSRNRSMSGVRPYVRASCNPDADSWVASFIAWWIDQDTGLPIQERAGALRYFVRVGETIIWADRPEGLADHTMEGEGGAQIPIPPKSVTFIPAKLTDNAALMRADPGYMASLLALPSVERERLLGGNWKVRRTNGMFKREHFEVIPAAPPGCKWVRGWDLAASKEATSAFTAGVLMGKTPQGGYVIAHVARGRHSPAEVEALIKNTSAQDAAAYPGSRGSIPQDPGAGGKAFAQAIVRAAAGSTVRATPETGDKVTRAMPFAAQVEVGNVKIVAGPWNKDFLDEIESFPNATIKDQVDAASRAFMELQKSNANPWGMGGEPT